MINKDNSISTKVSISSYRDGKKTRLKDSSFDIPYKVVHYGSKNLNDHLEVMLMCYSPGVMDGDKLQISVKCTADSQVKMFTQSYNKLHPMTSGASQKMTVHIQKNAIFSCFPLPTIPFKGSIFNTSNDIKVARSGHLIWGDVISGGRIHSDERFKFTKIHSRTKIYFGKQLVLFDNQLFEPAKQQLNGLLFFEGYSHQATFVLVSAHAQAIKAELDEMLKEQFVDIQYGFTLCNEHTILLRALGNTGETLHDWISKIGDMCWEYINSTTLASKVLSQKGNHHKKDDLKTKKSKVMGEPAQEVIGLP